MAKKGGHPASPKGGKMSVTPMPSVPTNPKAQPVRK
jgi:hypothetical protein